MQIWREREPSVRDHRLCKEAIVPERVVLHVRTARAADHWQHWRRIDYNILCVTVNYYLKIKL